MKFTPAILTLAAASSVAAAAHHPHRHGHAKRNPVAVEVVTVPGPTVFAYELNGKSISKDEACKGIKDGSLVWANSGNPNICDPAPETPVSPPKAGQQFYEKPKTEQKPQQKPQQEPQAPAPSPAQPSPQAPSPKPSTVDKPKPDTSSPSGGEGIDSDFPDGQLSCDQFPSQYGALAVNWVGLGGWSGIQLPTYGRSAITDIRTAIRGETCTEGCMCSYACPPGYQKTQWPAAQGATGQSVGGIECKNGKLRLTNPSFSKKLCTKGVGGIKVKNSMSQVCSICRTDYPGTEAQTVPLLSQPGATDPLTCPDASNYYTWLNKPTSAQYYVNPKGVGLKDACVWGDSSRPYGNFSPLNIGVGMRDGKIWASMFQNLPTTKVALDFKVEIQGEGLSGVCRYENGRYYDSNGSNEKGCTVQVISGEATYVFSE
ncbi:Sperm-associated antigen 4 protein [Ophidiomyces ophidiicola]|nr:Sperm-associated antigen 4 protein [Ophidiomyces ophidiicola]KAI1983408.1 Sperm-associated antigen 4 protein [Ophidiomyces ophidiicola]KAI1997710.1 Sperm-associated antigen 4 protein [Ophidiomyces ophidiicola]KAI1999602.1 Sperm-associated antigen 4 protein [Ophidiomyces ophidiicola]